MGCAGSSRWTRFLRRWKLLANGYSWRVVFRQTPQTGDEVVTDCQTAFTDVGGHTRMKLKYGLEQDRREDINHVARSLTYGYRLEASVQFMIFQMTEFSRLADVVSRLASEEWTTYFSLDGQATEQTVEITDYIGPEPLKGKTVIGASFEVAVRATDLVDAIPLIVQPAVPIVPTVGISLPSASVSWRGLTFFVPGATGVEDAWFICEKTAADAYWWNPINVGGP